MRVVVYMRENCYVILENNGGFVISEQDRGDNNFQDYYLTGVIIAQCEQEISRKYFLFW